MELWMPNVEFQIKQYFFLFVSSLRFFHVFYFRFNFVFHHHLISIFISITTNKSKWKKKTIEFLGILSKTSTNMTHKFNIYGFFFLFLRNYGISLLFLYMFLFHFLKKKCRKTSANLIHVFLFAVTLVLIL